MLIGIFLLLLGLLLDIPIISAIGILLIIASLLISKKKEGKERGKKVKYVVIGGGEDDDYFEIPGMMGIEKKVEIEGIEDLEKIITFPL